MTTLDLKKYVHRKPFRPFSVRLSNGEAYRFEDSDQLGGPKSCRVLIFFADDDYAVIHADAITEIID